MISSIQVFMAMNSLEKVLDLTVFCRLLCHAMGNLFRNMMNPVCNLCVTLFAACDASTNAVSSTLHPLGTGILVGNSSSASLKYSLKLLTLTWKARLSIFGSKGSKY